MWFKNNEVKILEGKVIQLKSDKEVLEDNIWELKKEVEQLKLTKKTEEENLKHMIKITEEKNEIRFEKKVILNDKEKWMAIEGIKDTYRDKLETRLNTEVDNIREMYSQILERLPNINGSFKGKM